MFAAWVALYPCDAWEPVGRHQQRGFEQYEFNMHLVTRPEVALVPEEDFCSRRAAGTTPLVHFYGQSQFAGKASIGSFAVQTCAALSIQQRRLVPEFYAWVRTFSKRSKSSAAKDFVGESPNSAEGVRRALGQPVVYEGVQHSTRVSGRLRPRQERIARQSLRTGSLSHSGAGQLAAARKNECQ